MKAKKVYENIKSVLRPKDVNPRDYLIWKFQNDLKIPINRHRSSLDDREWKWIRTLNFIIHYSRHDQVRKWIEKNTQYVAVNIMSSTNNGGYTIIDLEPKNNEGVSDILKPKSTEEISQNLDFVRSEDDLYIGHEYLVLDLGMNQWLNALQYDGFKDGKHIFVSAMVFDDFSIEYTQKELEDAIKDKEIAIDNTGMTDFI